MLKKIFYKNKKLFSIKKRKLFGMHNVENILASILICLKNNIPIEYIENAINNFNGIEHRLELVDTINNVMYISNVPYWQTWYIPAAIPDPQIRWNPFSAWLL